MAPFVSRSRSDKSADPTESDLRRRSSIQYQKRTLETSIAPESPSKQKPTKVVSKLFCHKTNIRKAYRTYFKISYCRFTHFDF